ncbi:MAG: hypothetical protein V4474_01370, partial [Patescibacteria group bacterium]
MFGCIIAKNTVTPVGIPSIGAFQPERRKRSMKKLILGRHGQQKNDPADTSFWKRRAPLDTAQLDVLCAVRDFHGTERTYEGRVWDSGLDRAKETAELLARQTSLTAIELDPEAIWGEDVWKAVSFQSDGKTEKSAAEMVVQHEDIVRPIGFLGANFLRRKVAEAPVDSQTMAITHGPIVDFIAGKLLQQWPLLTTFGKGDLLALDMYDDGMEGLYSADMLR